MIDIAHSAGSVALKSGSGGIRDLIDASRATLWRLFSPRVELQPQTFADPRIAAAAVLVEVDHAPPLSLARGGDRQRGIRTSCCDRGERATPCYVFPSQGRRERSLGDLSSPAAVDAWAAASDAIP
jgi:hypothetical protein